MINIDDLLKVKVFSNFRTAWWEKTQNQYYDAFFLVLRKNNVQKFEPVVKTQRRISPDPKN